jgi:hypothetical protein
MVERLDRMTPMTLPQPQRKQMTGQPARNWDICGIYHLLRHRAQGGQGLVNSETLLRRMEYAAVFLATVPSGD